jgi:predicted transcriptional regulator
MDIQALKIELAQKILQSDKPSLLQKVDQLLKMENPDDWWEELPKEIQDSINEGLKDAEHGKVYSHDQVVREAKEKYG